MVYLYLKAITQYSSQSSYFTDEDNRPKRLNNHLTSDTICGNQHLKSNSSSTIVQGARETACQEGLVSL